MFKDPHTIKFHWEWKKVCYPTASWKPLFHLQTAYLLIVYFLQHLLWDIPKPPHVLTNSA